MSERPERELGYVEWAYQWWQWATGSEVPVAPGTPAAPSEGGDGTAPPRAENLDLGINERYRPGIELAAQRTGLDPAAIAAIIDAEAAPVSGAKKAEMVEEAFRLRHPERDWDQRPLSAKDRADVDLIKEYKALAREKGWEETSHNAKSGAMGLTQFIASTWESEAEREGTHLNAVAREKGMLDADGNVIPGRKAELLELRKDPTLSIVAAAEYDSSVLDAVSQEKKSEPGAADRELAALHPERDFAQDPLDPKDLADAELIKEWKELDAASGTPLIPAGLTDDEKAKFLYLCHHEGEAGAIQFLDGSLTDSRAAVLLSYNVDDPDKRAALIAEHGGSESAAYKAWLQDYIDATIVPDNFRK
jgi:hypothetical protein